MLGTAKGDRLLTREYGRLEISRIHAAGQASRRSCAGGCFELTGQGVGRFSDSVAGPANPITGYSHQTGDVKAGFIS
jgi:hypothetical protein